MQNRRGALIKVDFPGLSAGFADCHPWEELGDQPLDSQLIGLKKGKTTPLTRRCIRIAQIDAEARNRNINLLKDVKPIKNHLLLPGIDAKVLEGYTRIKVKVGRNPKREVQRLISLFHEYGLSIKWRLDFNGRLTPDQFCSYMKGIEPFVEHIDYIEDPFPYEPSLWASMQKKYNVDFAADQFSEIYLMDPSHVYTVVKPAVQETDLFCKNHDKQIVVTSYLDHPFGQVSAFYEAHRINRSKKLSHCGLISHLVYQPNRYSERFKLSGDSLIFPNEGSGFGFDDLLEAEKWIAL